jgi:hypothetical protein
MFKFLITEVWHDRSNISFVGLKPGNVVRITEIKSDTINLLNSARWDNHTEDYVANLSVPVGVAELERYSSIAFELESGDERRIYPLAEQMLEFMKNLRPLITGFQKKPVMEVKTIAAVTIAFNEDYMLKKWVDYYGKILGYENLFIIDDGSENNPKNYLPKSVNVISQPRTTFESWRLCRSLSKLQRLLLETYDVVIALDSDEFLVTNREDCPTIKEHIQLAYTNDESIIQTQGWELIHLIDREPNLNENIPIGLQRKHLIRNNGFDKPAVANTEISFVIGNHWCFEQKKQDDDLIMLHLRHFDVNFSLEKLRKYKATSWANIDLANGFSNHQRIEEIELIDQFKEWVKVFTEATSAGKTDSAKIMPERWAAQLALAG